MLKMLKILRDDEICIRSQQLKTQLKPNAIECSDSHFGSEMILILLLPPLRPLSRRGETVYHRCMCSTFVRFCTIDAFPSNIRIYQNN